MGLDLLPDHSLSDLRLTSHTLFKKGTRLGTRSLPESPRISSDFDIHRLSLQLNRESKHGEFGCSRLKKMTKDQEENLSASARQRIKQIKERVVTTRRVCGMDITNSTKKREAQHSNELTCSPRTRFSDKENKPSTLHKSNSSSSFKPQQIRKKPTKVVILVPEQSQERVVKQQRNQCKKSPEIRKSTKAKPNRCCNNTSNSNHDFNSISTTEPPQKQINETQAPKSFEDASNCFTTIDENNPQEARNYKVDDVTTVSAEGRQYITRIMKLAGINTATMVDPSVFLKLEDSGENQCGSLALRWNRRMLFDLVIGELCSDVERCIEKSSSILGDVNCVIETKKFEEEIIGEIERDIVDALVRETAFETNLGAKLN